MSEVNVAARFIALRASIDNILSMARDSARHDSRDSQSQNFIPTQTNLSWIASLQNRDFCKMNTCVVMKM